MLSDPCGKQAFVDGITMHVVTVAQLMEHAMPYLSKHKVPCPLPLACRTLRRSIAVYLVVSCGCCPHVSVAGHAAVTGSLLYDIC